MRPRASGLPSAGPTPCSPPSRTPASGSTWWPSRGMRTIRYLAVDGEGNAVTDRSLVRDAVAMLALAERADEVSGAVAADQLEEAFATAATELGSAGLAAERDAADAVRRSLAALSAEAAGPRVATPAYLDRIAACAAELSGGARRLRRPRGAPAARPGGARSGGVAGDGRRGADGRPRQPGDVAHRGRRRGRRAGGRRPRRLRGRARVMHTFDRAVAASLPLVPRTLVRRFADRYIAGETLEDAVATVRRLNGAGHAWRPSTSWGSSSASRRRQRRRRPAYERVLDAIAAEQPRRQHLGQALGARDRARPRPRRPHARAGARRRRAPRHLRAHRHGALRPHRPHAARLSRPARGRPRADRSRPPGVPAPDDGRRRARSPTWRRACAW